MMLKKDKKFEKLLRKEYSKQYKCDITAHDIEGLDLVKKVSPFNANNYWKWSSICTTVLLIALMLVQIIFLSSNITNNSYNSSDCIYQVDKNILSLYEKNTIINDCNYFVKETADFRITLKGGVLLYIYEGIKMEMHSKEDWSFESIYYIVAKNLRSGKHNQITVNIDGRTLVLDKDNTICELGRYFYSEDVPHMNVIDFKITYHNQTMSYSFMD